MTDTVHTVSIAEGPCPMCGRDIAKRPRCGKLRRRHKCPHGKWCDQGNPLVGAHSFLPHHSTNCGECRAQNKAHPRGFGHDALSDEQVNNAS